MEQQDFAKVLDTTPQHLSAILNGGRQAGKGLALKLEILTGLSRIVWMFASSDDRPKDHDEWIEYSNSLFGNQS